MRSAIWIGVGLVAWLAIVGCERAEGPAPVAWDRTRCDRCGMLVSEPAFAAQRHLPDGSVRHFDDPGCLFVDADGASDPAAHRLWFRHHVEDRWLAGDEVAFVETANTPMGYGLGAVAAGRAEALSLEAAWQRVTQRDEARRGQTEATPPDPRGDAGQGSR